MISLLSSLALRLSRLIMKAATDVIGILHLYIGGEKKRPSRGTRAPDVTRHVALGRIKHQGNVGA